MNFTRPRSIAILIAVATLVYLGACTKPLGEIGFSESEQPRYAIPLLETTFSLRDALQGFDFIGTLSEGADGLRLVRRDTVFNDRVVSSVDIPDLAAPLPDTFNTVSLLDFGLDLPVSAVGIRFGFFNYGLVSDSDETLDVELRVFNFIDGNGDTLTINETLAPGETIEGQATLGGRELRLNGTADFTVNYTARTPSGEPAVLALALIQMQQVVTQYVVGSLDSFAYDLGSSTIDTEFLSSFEPNTASVRDASVRVELTTTAPVPLRFDGLGSYAALRDGTRFPFNTSLQGGVLLNQPAFSGDTMRTSFTLDDSNSSLLDAVRQFPDSLVFESQAVVNPAGLMETYRVEYEDRVIGTFVFDVPLAVDFDGFSVDQGFTFGELEQADNLSNAELVIATKNLIGLAARAQVYLLDENDQAVDSLFAEPQLLIEAAEIDATGAVASPTSFVARVPLSGDQLSLIRQRPVASAKVFLDTPNDDPSQFAQLDYADQITLSLGLNFQLK